VVLFTTSSGKIADALRLGAHEVVLSKDPAAMQKHIASLDFLLDTVSAVHDLNAYLELLKRDGTMTLVGAPPQPVPLGVFSLLFKRRRLGGSAIGGIRETQEMLDFCATHGITADVERIRIQQIDEAFARLLRNDVKYRFVIDMASLKQG
jgi:alcohol dehydrogenase (NADP+)